MEAEMKGYTGKILFIDLDFKTYEVIQPDSTIYENYLSGVGLASYYLYNSIPKDANPLGNKNVIAFVSGLLTGTGSLITGRWLVATKSPLTGGWGDANCGGTFSPAIKQCGYDGIFVKGISQEPCYIHIDNKSVTFVDAKDLWGMDSVETEEILEKRYSKGKKPSIATIGQAGENLSLISGIVNEKGRIAARSGVGAVMGSKRLKAIVLQGSLPIKAVDTQGIKELSAELANKVRSFTLPNFVKGSLLPLGGSFLGNSKKVTPLDGMMLMPIMKKWGTPGTTTMAATMGDSPIKNWSSTIKEFDKSYYKKFNPDIVTKREYEKYHCYSCIIGCGGKSKINDLSDGKYDHTHKPEYETLSSFGSLIMSKDIDSIYIINEMLNRAGMDTISAGHVVSHLMESFDKGLISEEDLDGIRIVWGDSKAAIKILEKMIKREGVGDLLADGVKVAASKLGKTTDKYAIHCGGQEPAMHDSRLDPMLGVIYSADTTPGRHTTGSSQYYNLIRLWDKVSWAPKVKRYDKSDEYVASEEEALKTVANVAYKQFVDSIGGCLFAMILGVQHWKIFEWSNLATGWNKTPDDYMEIGRRIQTTKQLFNLKHSIDPLSFKMPDRLSGKPPLESGPTKGKTLPIDEMITNFFYASGWDNNGVPTNKIIKELKLDTFLEDING
jgi:aldehyde:ferredoxin oxidoreductase